MIPLSLVKQLINRSEASWNIPLHLLFSEQKNNGEYIVKLGYHRLMANKRQIHGASSSRQDERNEESWSHIWNLKTLPKIQNFIWKACHNVVPSNENLIHRHHSRTSSCLRCGEPNESLEHILFFYPLSHAIWRASTFHYSSPLNLRNFNINIFSIDQSQIFRGIRLVGHHHGEIVDGINAQVHSSSAFVAKCLALRLGSSLIRQHN
ncbi:hypothetical protein V6N12_074319 [Hibiscus sabdariffa]|uniref:Reverse transcriptase zinc-binding domain-containing protein n=1 Tax=Hibiscus sabdariffa TaxID=183260 RepID=A0ABR2BKR6_9ROSI